MKLALVAYLHGAGGAERQITMLANAMAQRGHNVYLLVLAEFNKIYDIDKRVNVRDLTGKEREAIHPLIGRYKVLRRAYIDIKPDVTIHYNLQSAYLTTVMPKSLYNKCIYSERGDPYDVEYNGILGIIRSWCVNKIDGFVFQSEGAQAFFSKSVQKRSVVIHNSVTVPEYPTLRKRDNRIVSVGRLHRQKNHAMLIEAFSKIANEFPEVELVNYGDGELREDIEKLISDYGLTERVHLLPSRKDIFDTIRQARLFVLSSDYEGMPNALLEAMALGLPCISTDCRPGGARTLIVDGENGYIVPRKDIDAMAHKMRYVLSHSEVANKIAHNAQSIAKTHTIDYIFNRYEAYIQQVNQQVNK